jgi:hypothetical protein
MIEMVEILRRYCPEIGDQGQGEGERQGEREARKESGGKRDKEERLWLTKESNGDDG